MAGCGNWLQNLTAPGSARQLALFRIVAAVHLFTVFQSPALGVLAAVEAKPHPMAGTLLPGSLEALLSWSDVQLVATLGSAAAVLMALGLWTKLATCAVLGALLVTQNYWFRATVFHDDWLYFPFPLLVLLFSRCADRLSLDARLRPARPQPRARPNDHRWPVELIVLGFALQYVAAGLAKLFPLRKGLEWLSGRSVQGFAIEFVHDSPAYWLRGHSLFDYTTLWPFTLASYGTVAVELLALGMLSRRPRLWLWLLLLMMHASIWWLGIPGFVQIALVFGVVMLPAEAFRDVPHGPATL